MTWPTIELDTAADVIRGVTFSKGDASDKPAPGLVPVLRAGNIGDQLNTEDDLVFVDEGFVSKNQRLQPDDIVVCMSSGSANVLGKSAILDSEWKGSFGAFLATVRPRADIVFPRFLAHYLRTSQFRAWASSSSGIGIKNIRASDFKSYSIPLPPIEEQRRIAGILDQADTLRRLRSRALDKLNTLGQAIFHEMFGDLIANERGFAPVVVGDVIDGFETGKNLAGDPDEGPPDGFRVLKISAVTTGIFKSEESKPLPPNYEPPEAHIVRDGDLLFSRANTAQLIGATAFARTNSARLVLPDKLWRFVWKRKSKVRPEFVKALFSSPSFRYEIGKRSSGTSGSMKNIGQQKVMTIPFGLPSIDLQQEFSKRQSVVTGQAEKNQKLLETCENLFASLQHRAFKGEL